MFSEVKAYKSFLIFLFIFSFFVRSLFFLFFMGENKNYWSPDSPAYHEIAVQLVNKKYLSDSNNQPNFYRLPGYPVFLSIFYKLFDFDIKKTLWIQIFISCFIPILVFFLSLALFPQNILLAKISSFYSSIHLGFIIFSGYFLTETLFVLFFLTYLILFYLFFDSKKIFLAGLFLGIASLFRPVGHYLVFLSIIILLLSKLNFLERIRNSFLLSIGWLIPVLPWLLRNFLLTGCIFFHTLPGRHFLNHTAAYIVMNKYNFNYKQARDFLAYALDKELIKQKKVLNRDLNEIEACRLTEKISFDYIKQEPILFIRHSFTNILKTIFMPFGEELLFIQNKSLLFVLDKIKQYLCPLNFCVGLIILMYLEIFFMLLTLAGSLGFLISLILLKKYLFLLKTFSFVFLFVFITLAAGFARLRLPIEPLICVLAFRWWQRVLQ